MAGRRDVQQVVIHLDHEPCPQYVQTEVHDRTAMSGSIGVPSGHVFRVERKRGPVWYAKYRLPSGRQVQNKLGPAGLSVAGRQPAT